MSPHDSIHSAIGLTGSNACAVATKGELAAALTTLYDLLTAARTTDPLSEHRFLNVAQLCRTFGISRERAEAVLSNPRTAKTIATQQHGIRTLYSLRDFRLALASS